jgi:hypothetical protein
VILISIIACEVGFWIAIGAGLVARYAFDRPKLGGVLLLAAPVIDLILLALVAVDLLGRGTASWHHGLAALYIGISVAYGHRMIAWADNKFAARFRGAARRPALFGSAYAVGCWKDVLRTALASAVAAAILGGLVLIVGDVERTSELLGFFPILGLIVVIDFVWAVSYSIWPKRAPAVRAG